MEGDLIKNTLDSEYSEQKMLICTSEFVDAKLEISDCLLIFHAL